MKKFQEFLKNCSKDDTSYKKLVKFVEELVEEKEVMKNYLQLLESATRSDYDSILITTLDLEEPGPKIVYVNDGFTRMTGYTRDEVIGKTPRILQGPKTDRAVLDTLKNKLQEGQSFFGHTVNYRKDGSEFVNQWDIHPLPNPEGEITHWVSYQHDITERKRSESKIVDAQIEFDRLTEESKKTLVDLDEQGNIITSNKAFRDLIGYDDDELKKKKVWELLSDEDRENFGHKFDKFKPGDFEHSVFELSLKNKNGHSIEVNMDTRLLKIDDQTVVRASLQNKSLQKRIMAMLKKRNSKFENMFDAGKEFRYKLLKNKDGKYFVESVSDSFQKISGLSGKQVANMPLASFIHSDDIEKVNNHIEVVFNGKPNTEQYRIRSKDGGFITIIDYAKPVWNVAKTTVEEVKGSVSTDISSVSRYSQT